MAQDFHARFRAMWPYWVGGYPNQQEALSVYRGHESDLRSQLARTVAERLGSHFSIRDVSARLFEPNGIEVVLAVEGPPHAAIDASLIESVVRELGDVTKTHFQLHMPGAQAGANAYDIDSEFWVQGGRLKKVGLTEAGSDPARQLSASPRTAPTNERGSQLVTLSHGEVEELLTALAGKHLRPYDLATDGPKLRENVEQLLATLRLLRAVSDRPENAVLYRELGNEIETTPARPVIDSLRNLGILDALDDAPALLFSNLDKSVIPREDLDLLLRGGVEDPGAALTLMAYRAREFASAGKVPSEVLEEAPEVLRRQGEQMKREQTDVAPPRKRKIFNGIGNVITGLVTGGGNGLLAAGTIVAPNPATAFLAIGSAAMAIGAVFKGVGDLRGE